MRRSGFFPRLALVNLARNGRFYGPYLLSCIVTAAMYYILLYLSYNRGLEDVRGAMYLRSFAGVGCLVAALLSAVMLLYANSFVMKRRRRELGLYNILGLEKRHVARMCAWETLLCAAVTLAGGVLLGVLLSKAILLLLLKTARIPAQFGMEISWRGIAETAELFGVLFLLTLARNLWQIGRAKPVELLHSASAGEREPRTKWLLVVLGVLTLGGGYVLAITTKNPVDAMMLFFCAVILVIIGTYCLFTAGSIAVLKRLRADPKFYYRTRHFTAVSGLLYRMKQNAVGLASICILSTMVLVTISTTIAMNIGLEDSLNEMFPYDIEFIQDLERQPGDPMEHMAEVHAAAEASGGYTQSRYYTRYWCYCGVRGSEISLNLDQDCLRTEVQVVTAEDYGRLTGNDVILAPDEVLAYARGLGEFPADFTISAFFSDVPAGALAADDNRAALSFHVREEIAETIRHAVNTLLGKEDSELFLVVADKETAETIMDLDTSRSARQFRVQMDLAGKDYGEKLAQTEQLVLDLSRRDDGVGFTSKQEQAQEYYAMYGGFLFLGVFLGILFLLATVLIIYYKQISEGYEDQRRYLILRQVGMSGREVNASIHSQILLVFFLPLGAAAVHVFMAFPMLSKMLELFNIYDVKLFVLCTLGTLAVFCLIYALVFLMTARAYSRIVGGTERD
ncbi:FtsX-like permease family protein [uncultured Oscillibacter sp.]|uniref:ABC transporter permease n=1 Tax=uncultured Oscillibacter sp. TaxID=876091 RepID=UPI0025CC2B37|nr:FtsX-like permease family protein [uncultured Oscillibacter sp.]